MHYQKAYQYKHIGYSNIEYTLEEIPTELENIKWIKSDNYKINL